MRPQRDTRAPLVRDPAGRLPPNALESEKALLSVICEWPQAIEAVADMLPADDVWSDENRKIYAAAREIHARGRKADYISIVELLKERDEFAAVGGEEYFNEWRWNPNAVLPRVTEYATAIVRAAVKRRVIAEAQTIAAEGYGDTPDEWADGVAVRLERAAGAGATGPDRGGTGKEVLTSFFSRLANPEKSTAVVLSTGIEDLDRMIGGLRQKHLITIAAGSGIGKSALAANIAAHVAVEGRIAGQRCGVAIFSAEMGADEYLGRMVSSLAGVNNAKLLPGNEWMVGVEEWQSITGAAQCLAVNHLYVDDRADVSPSQIRMVAKRLAVKWQRAGHPLRLIVVDYAQILKADEGGNKNGNREQEVARISRAMKVLASDLDVTLILLAQINKESIKEGRRPRASDLRESQALLNDSNAVVLIYNPGAEQRAEQYRNGEDVGPADEADEVDLIAGKVRGGGRQGSVRAIYKPACTRFLPWQGDPTTINVAATPSRKRGGR